MAETTPARAVRQKCLDCCGNSPLEVRLCTVSDCHRWPWRFGKNPRSLQRQRPEWLDREYVRRRGELQCQRELRLISQPAQIVDISHTQSSKESADHEHTAC